MRQRGTWDETLHDFDIAEETVFGRPRRHRPTARRDASSPEEARRWWEPVVCPRCGREHLTTRTVRLRRAGGTIEARCTGCGSVAAVFTGGVWTS